MAWHVVWCGGAATARAERALRAAGIATYRPIEAVQAVKRGQSIEIERAPMGRYLFVGLNASAPQFGAVRDALEDRTASGEDFSYLWHGKEFWVPTRNVIVGRPLGRLLAIDDTPLRVPASALQSLADGLTLYGQQTTRKARFAAGQAVKARDGAFAGFLGTVQSSDDYRVRALLDIFGRSTPVEFESGQLEAA